MQQFSNREVAELKSRIDEIHELLAARSGERPSGSGPYRAEAPSAALVQQLSLSIHIRRIRRTHFGDAEMAGPVWDMMLDLMMAQSRGRSLSASDLATGAAVPLSSGLRMIAALERQGLAERSIDERDRRRTIVRLTEYGNERMASYFEKIGAASQNHRTLAA
ncbi:MAG: winged helix DNA-binding protein [Sphingopyxis sp.]|nr:winged helix DNA-binding protein [Sphingopyxis sp.]